jgi:putative SOS response-associated peptidase YedK
VCGRFVLKAPVSQLISRFKLDEAVDVPPRYNIAPGTGIPTIRHSPEGKRVMHLLRWGLIPHWAKDPGLGAKLSNARGEAVADKPAFRDAFNRRRCLVPVDGFYEWKATGKQKQPYYFSLKSGEPFALGGLWESWRTSDGDILRTCCLITTGPNETMAPVHDRMPVIVSRGDVEVWLTGDANDAQVLIRPYSSEDMQAWAVSRRVNRSGEEGADIIHPVENEHTD